VFESQLSTNIGVAIHSINISVGRKNAKSSKHTSMQEVIKQYNHSFQ